jgi:hypothetical protein
LKKNQVLPYRLAISQIKRSKLVYYLPCLRRLIVSMVATTETCETKPKFFLENAQCRYFIKRERPNQRFTMHDTVEHEKTYITNFCVVVDLFEKDTVCNLFVRTYPFTTMDLLQVRGATQFGNGSLY